MWKAIFVIGILLPVLIQGQVSRGLRGSQDGVIRSLEARIEALEKIIQEYQEKETLLQDRSDQLEHRSLELTKIARENERQIQQRRDALDTREAEITAYQNQVFKDQDLREQEIERAGREKERSLNQRLRSTEQAEQTYQ